MHAHARTHKVRSPGCVWLSFLASAISHPREINRGSGIGARANWALLSLFSYCCQERFVIAAPGSHTAGPGGAVLRSDRSPFGCHREDVHVWLSDLAKPNSQRKASSQDGLYFVLVLGCTQRGDNRGRFWLLRWWFAAVTGTVGLVQIFSQPVKRGVFSKYRSRQWTNTIQAPYL